MDLINLVSNIHWLPVVVLTIFSFILGAVWHMPFLFGRTWKKENNLNDDHRKVNVPLVFGGTAVTHFLAISGISAVASGLGGTDGLIAGLLVSLVLVFPAMAGTYLFAGRSIKLLAIDAGMYLVLFSIAGFVLGVW